MNNVHYLSKSTEWETPQEFYDKLNAEFHFTLDPCATPQNAKCDKYFTATDDGLSQSWDNERVFCNPPYGRAIGKWVKKASESKGLVVMLMPARTDTSYFHNYIYGKAEIRFLRGRLKFVNKMIADYTGKTNVSPAPFPSIVVIFNREMPHGKRQVESQSGTCPTV